MKPSFVFTLIHGTFSPDADWIRPDSFMQKFLERRFPGCLITAPIWPGINTHWGRLKASDDIAQVLLRQRQQYPDAKHFVIAHSHGGTIALHACGDELVRKSLSGVITLGTPFIHSRRRDLRVPVRVCEEIVKLGRNLSLAWLWTSASLLLGAVSFLYDAEGVRAVDVFCLLLFIGIFLWSIKLRLRRSFLRAVFAATLKKARTKQHILYASMREPYRFVSDLRLFAISVDFDEARMYLRMLRGLGGLAHLAHYVLSHAIRPAVYISFVLGFAVLLKRLYLFYERTPDIVEFLIRSTYGIAEFQFWGLLWMLALSLLLHGLMILWPLIRLHQYGYGEMSLWLNWLLDIHDRKSPGFGPKWSFWRAPSEAKPGERHSFFYNDLAVQKKIAEWIESPELFPGADGPEPVPGKRQSAPIVVRVLSWILLMALAIWLWLEPSKIYHI
jgi:pimeloyl-ACP methyl ester carboxylesterase